MQQTSALVEADTAVMEATHNDPTTISDNALRTLFEGLLNEVTEPDMLYLDDMEVHTKDQAHDSEHDHINKKEIVSGDAVVWIAEEDHGGEIVRQHEVEYGVYAGTQGGDFVYSPVEVELIPK